MEKKWFVYESTNDLMLSGYPGKVEAMKEAKRVKGEATGEIEIIVLPRSDNLIRYYAESHPHWAKVHGYKHEGPEGKEEPGNNKEFERG